jgi:hypothetical protein
VERRPRSAARIISSTKASLDLTAVAWGDRA